MKTYIPLLLLICALSFGACRSSSRACGLAQKSELKKATPQVDHLSTKVVVR